MAGVKLFPSIIPTTDSDDRDAHDQAAIAIENGECPWCPEDDRYEGDAVAQHAGSAHPDEWAAYQDARE